MRSFSMPFLASSFTPPGSSTTYRPGIPRPPATNVISISSFSTAAGAASPLAPCPLASKPTASIAASTTGSPRISAICSPSLSCFEISTVSKPTFFACASLSAWRSPMMITAAPKICALAAAASPPAPAPRPGKPPRAPPPHPRRYRAVEAGRQDVRQHGQVGDLLHSLFLVGKLQKVEIGIGHQHIIRLSTHPAAHIHIAVGSARLLLVHVQAHAGIAFAAGGGGAA